MAKQSRIQLNNKRIKLVQKYENQRSLLKRKKKISSHSMDEKYQIMRELEKLPRNSSPTRVYRRCSATGRPRGVYRDFGLSRHVLREMAHKCLLPGVVKASW